MKYIAILRGINVSGKNIIKMADLKSALLSNGYANVKTYIQSGNLVFTYKEEPVQQIASELSALVANHFGLVLPVIVLDAKQLNDIVKKNTFLENTDVDTKQLYVTFLARTPELENSSEFREHSFSPDEFVLTDEAIYLKIPESYGNTKLSNAYIERKLKVTATTRNWKTVLKLQEMINQ